MQKVKYRWATSLGGGFEGTPEEVWGVEPYNPETDKDKPCAFCGLYGLKDFMALNSHKGKKWIWWAGSDIRHFVKGYWIDDKGKIRVNPKPFAEWIQKNCESWVENKAEADLLKRYEIKAKICPSFLGDVSKFKPQKEIIKNSYYSSVSGNDFKLYGWDKINKIAKQNPQNTYYLYGNTIPWKAPKNVIVKGRIDREVMNEEIKGMTGAIRMIEVEGCSEIIVKSVLWGQKPISLIKYPFLKSRESLLKIINRYPWNLTKNYE